jgi:hypothetical protein
VNPHRLRVEEDLLIPGLGSVVFPTKAEFLNSIDAKFFDAPVWMLSGTRLPGTLLLPSCNGQVQAERGQATFTDHHTSDPQSLRRCIALGGLEAFSGCVQHSGRQYGVLHRPSFQIRVEKMP